MSKVHLTEVIATSVKRLLKSKEVAVLEGKVLTKEELENLAREMGFSLVEIEIWFPLEISY